MSEIIIKDGDYIKVPFDLSCGSLKVTAVADGKEYDVTPYIKPIGVIGDEIGKGESPPIEKIKQFSKEYGVEL